MPRINKNFTLEVTPEQFLNNCSSEELREVDLLLSKPLMQAKMNHRLSEETEQCIITDLNKFLAGDKDRSIKPERTCRVCGCTDEDCRQCIEKTGESCSWVAEDLCSACYEL